MSFLAMIILSTSRWNTPIYLQVCVVKCKCQTTKKRIKAINKRNRCFSTKLKFAGKNDDANHFS